MEFMSNLLGIDVLKGQKWTDNAGGTWTFGVAKLDLQLLVPYPPLPPSRLTLVKPYSLPLGTKQGIAPIPAELRVQGVIVLTHSPYNSAAWPVQKPNGKWCLMIYYSCLNANMGPLTAAVHNIA